METANQAGAYKKPVMSVGTEFMAYVETYFRLEKVFPDLINPQYANYTYEDFKKGWADQIDSIITNRIKHYL